ncbi:unnamed protein product [Boreogadus saida]
MLILTKEDGQRETPGSSPTDARDGALLTKPLKKTACLHENGAETDWQSSPSPLLGSPALRSVDDRPRRCLFVNQSSSSIH